MDRKLQMAHDRSRRRQSIVKVSRNFGVYDHSGAIAKKKG